MSTRCGPEAGAGDIETVGPTADGQDGVLGEAADLSARYPRRVGDHEDELLARVHGILESPVPDLLPCGPDQVAVVAHQGHQAEVPGSCAQLEHRPGRAASRSSRAHSDCRSTQGRGSSTCSSNWMVKDPKAIERVMDEGSRTSP